MRNMFWDPIASDYFIAIIMLGLIFFIVMRSVPRAGRAVRPRRLLKTRLSVISMVVFSFYLGIAALDSIHFSYADASVPGGMVSQVSVLDALLSPIDKNIEKSFSKPLAISLSGGDGSHLKYVGHGIKTKSDRNIDVLKQVLLGIVVSLLSVVVFYFLFISSVGFVKKGFFWVYVREKMNVFHSKWWCAGWFGFFLVWTLFLTLYFLSRHYHVFGTDQVGADVFYMNLKSIRTAILVGMLSTIFMLPFALLLGVMAGYFGKWVDDLIQYIYITLSSIPGVLLISASILVVQVYMANHPHLFPSSVDRADTRLILLCMVLGLTSWATLCRVLRAETMKVKNLEYIQVSKTLGASSFRIIFKHVIPNVLHLVIITLVLDFSGLVLSEAVLSYVGVGVDPITFSWGNMINSSRLEMSRDPVVWWPLVSALLFMFFIVLAANVLADAVREHEDVRLV